jgi:hypothetical protein
VIHVHIIPSGTAFALRVGMFRGVVSYQTAEAAHLDVITRDGTGYGIPDCLDRLTRTQAEALGQQLDDWLCSVGAFGHDPKKLPKRLAAVSDRYKTAMVEAPRTWEVRHLPLTVPMEVFQRRMAAAGGAEGSRFGR